MAGSVTGKTAALNGVFKAATRYIGLHTSDPGVTGSDEVSGNNYSRVSVSGSDWTISSTTGILTNDNEILFPTPDGDWPNAPAFWSLNSGATGGFMWGFPIAGTPASPVVDGIVRFPPNAINISVL